MKNLILLNCLLVLFSSCNLPKFASNLFQNNNQRLDCVISESSSYEPIVYLFNISGYSSKGASEKSDLKFNDAIDRKNTINTDDDIVYAKAYFLQKQAFDAFVIPIKMKSGKNSSGLISLQSIKISYEQKMYHFSKTTTWEEGIKADEKWMEGKKGDVTLEPNFSYVNGSNVWRNGKCISAALSAEELGFFVIPLKRVDDNSLASYLKLPVINSQQDYERFKPNGGDYIACQIKASATLTVSKDKYYGLSTTALPTSIDATVQNFDIHVKNIDDTVSTKLDTLYSLLFFYSLDGDDVIPKYVTGFPPSNCKVENEGVIEPNGSISVKFLHKALPNITCQYAHPYFSYSEAKHNQ